MASLVGKNTVDDMEMTTHPPKKTKIKVAELVARWLCETTRRIRTSQRDADARFDGVRHLGHELLHDAQFGVHVLQVGTDVER